MASSGKLRDGGGMFGRNQRARVAGACRLAVATVGLLWGPAAWAQKPLGIDVSLWQGTITPANWTQVYNSGRRFAFIKASQGTTVTDPRFYSNVANAPVAGLLVAPYHFADPLNERQPADGHTAVDEANYFVAVAGNYMTAGYLPPVLDLEYGSSMGKTALSNWANSFCNRVLALKGVRPLIYANTNYAANYLNSTVTVWDLWIANWNYTDPQTQNPPTGVWPTWKFWQYSSTGSVPGISGNCDLDVFNGTLAQLQAYVISGTPAVISRSPASLTRTVRAGLNAASQTFTVANSGSGTLNYTIESDVTWASINPTEGSSTGQTDTITVNYATSLLNIGTHTGTVTITALGATNSPQTVGLTMIVEAVPGDLDQDGDIDVNDATLFGTCLGGADVPISEPACASADLDGDGDADLSDYGLMQKCTSGPAVKAEPHCVN